MLAFYYDKSFSGLLSAVFEVFAAKRKPGLLLGEGAIAPLTVTSALRVATDQVRADRVWQGLRKRLSPEGLNDLNYVWLSEQEGADQLLFRYLCKIFSKQRLIQTDYADQDVLAVSGLARKVYHESHALLGFTRFQKTSSNVYFGAIAPRYNTLPLIIEHFADRFADQTWILFDVRRHYGVYCENAQFSQVSLEPAQLHNGQLRQEWLDDQELLFQELWRGYLKSVTIHERINPKLQANLMPRRFRRQMCEFAQDSELRSPLVLPNNVKPA